MWGRSTLWEGLCRLHLIQMQHHICDTLCWCTMCLTMGGERGEKWSTHCSPTTHIIRKTSLDDATRQKCSASFVLGAPSISMKHDTNVYISLRVLFVLRTDLTTSCKMLPFYTVYIVDHRQWCTLLQMMADCRRVPSHLALGKWKICFPTANSNQQNIVTVHSYARYNTIHERCDKRQSSLKWVVQVQLV